jgi:tripartite-type tricarboxylate transporter receptor subunit TctC
VQGKAINAIAVAGAKRAEALPDVPTVAETVPGFEASSWFGLVAPAKTPQPALAKLSGELETILKMPDVKKRLAELGAEPGTVVGDAFAQFMTDETAKWGKLVKASGATVD